MQREYATKYERSERLMLFFESLYQKKRKMKIFGVCLLIAGCVICPSDAPGVLFCIVFAILGWLTLLSFASFFKFICEELGKEWFEKSNKLNHS